VARAEFDPSPFFELLIRHDVDFVVIGGIAAASLGSARATIDIDIAYAREGENLERLAQALREAEATLRGAPPDLPFLLDAETLEAGQNFTFTTRFGPLDILGDPAGAPPYRELRADATPVEIRGFTVPIASVDHLIAMKEAAGRTHDKAVAQELRTISDALRRPPPE
jgi:nucleotidyltransferase AbiEii toxin of type IV toxin-antitoxin system